MAVREFAANEYITWSIGTGGLDDVLWGAFTVAAIVKRSAFTPADQGALLDFAAGLSGSRGFFRYTDANVMNYLRGQFQSPGDGPSWTSGDDWVLVAFTKAAGTVTVRYHKYVYSSTTWTHANAAGTVEDDDNVCDRVQTRFMEDSAWVFRGRYAVMGVWGSVLSDSTLEGLTAQYSEWESAAPMALWRFDQASTSTPIDDQTGNGADQTALVGSTVITTDDPPGFSFAAAEAGTTNSPWRRPTPGVRGPTAEPRAWRGVPSAQVAVALADTAAGDDQVAVQASVSLTDTAAADDALTSTAETPLPDTASGADAVAVVAQLDLADSAATADQVTVSVPLDLPDTAAAADQATVSATLDLTDAVVGSDQVTVVAATNLAESASAADAISVDQGATPKALDDTAAGDDAVAATAAASLSETAAATDAATIAAEVPLADSAAASDALTVTVTISFTDNGSATDAVEVLTAAALSEAAAGLDALGIASTAALADAGAASDQLTAQDGVQKALTETAAAADRLRVTIVRPNTGTIARPDTGTIPRPFTGVILRP